MQPMNVRHKLEAGAPPLNTQMAPPTFGQMPPPEVRKTKRAASNNPTAGYKVCVGCHNKIHNRVRKCPTCGVFNYPKGIRLPGTRGWRVCEKCNNTSVFVGKHAPQEKCNVVDCGWTGPLRKERKDRKKPSPLDHHLAQAGQFKALNIQPMHPMQPSASIQIQVPTDQLQQLLQARP